MQLGDALARLDRYINYERFGHSIAAGDVSGLSLTSMRELVSLLGDPQSAYPVIHVTGTNGKGSVARMITELLVAAGLTVGTYSSPHLYAINERISRNGEPIPDDELAATLTQVLALDTMWSTAPTWFELVTATAFAWFAEVAVDVAVVEVGLLGRYDATNVVESAVAVLTNIGGDHTDFSPGWELKVASEKAGIVTPGGDAVVGPMAPELRATVEAEGPGRLFAFGDHYDVTDSRVAIGGRMVSLVTPYGHHDDVFLPVHGEHQATNAAIAVMATEAFFDRVLDETVVEAAMASLTLPGRIEVVSHRPLVILDGAHNVDAAARLVETLGEEFAPAGSRRAVVGMLAGRDPGEFVAALGAFGFDLVVATTPPSPRGLPAAALAAALAAAGIAHEVIDDPTDAVRRTVGSADEEDLVVVAGSFYLIGPARLAMGSAS